MAMFFLFYGFLVALASIFLDLGLATQRYYDMLITVWFWPAQRLIGRNSFMYATIKIIAVCLAVGMLCWSRQPGSAALSPVGTSPVMQVTLAVRHGCLLSMTGVVWCWGANTAGQLGDRSTTSSLHPSQPAALALPAAAVVAGGYHTCSLTAAKSVWCWGDNYFGQLGDGTIIPYRSTPSPVSGLAGDVVALSAGFRHTCALQGAQLRCWGDNDSGQLGDGSLVRRSTPSVVVGLNTPLLALATGDSHTCVVTLAGAVFCWGDNTFGQLGDGTTVNRAAPTPVVGLSHGVLSVVAGKQHTCAVAEAGAVFCWGANAAGQLGDGSTLRQTIPVPLLDLPVPVAALAAGNAHTCALSLAGAVFCWGANAAGQLGDGTTTARVVPTAATGLNVAVAGITASADRTCALTAIGTVLCWGYQPSGLFGGQAWLVPAALNVPVRVFLPVIRR